MSFSEVKGALLSFQSDFETTAKFKVGGRGGLTCAVPEEDEQSISVPQVQLFSEPGFQGSDVVLEDSVASLQDGFCVASCKVLSGRYTVCVWEHAQYGSGAHINGVNYSQK